MEVVEQQPELKVLVRERVERGVRFLDRKYGYDWDSAIDLGTLRLCSGEHCVLGQVYKEQGKEDGACGYAWAASHFEDIDPAGMGFLYGKAPGDIGESAYYRLLDREWKDVIEKRRASV